jgi:galactokinase
VQPEEQAVSHEVHAFAPGRVNLIGEHTDYNGGLALPFAIASGVTVRAWTRVQPRIYAHALDLGEDDEFALGERRHGEGWRAFVRGIVAELDAAGISLPGAELQIQGEVPRGAGLSSSAALAVALGSALLGLAHAKLDRRTLARLCSRVENQWVGARTGLLDQLASLFGEADTALRIDFSDLAIDAVPFVLESDWRLATIDSGERHNLAASGYNERRAECARACELLGIQSLSQAREHDAERLPAELARRLRHVLGENARVEEAVLALRAGDLVRVGRLLDASHASLRDRYECSTPAVEATVRRLQRAGATGARMIGGGFGGHVLGLFPPGTSPPPGAHEVRPSPGARLVSG